MALDEAGEGALRGEHRDGQRGVPAAARPCGDPVEELVGKLVGRRQHELTAQAQRPVADDAASDVGDEVVLSERESGRLPLAPQVVRPHACDAYGRTVLRAQQLCRRLEIVPAGRTDRHAQDCGDTAATLPLRPHRLVA